MTVSYHKSIRSVSPLTFLNIVFRWRGSVWKGIILELFFWTIIAYYVAAAVGHFVHHQCGDTRGSQCCTNEMSEKERIRNATFWCIYSDYIIKIEDLCAEYREINAISFLLSFFINIALQRWMRFVDNISWIDNVAIMTQSSIPGDDDESQAARRNIIRYLCVSQILVYRDISKRVRLRFPTLFSLHQKGYLSSAECNALEAYDKEIPNHWIPIRWACEAIRKMRDEEKIINDQGYIHSIKEIITFRTYLEKFLNGDLFPIPLAYPQVVATAIRILFFSIIISRKKGEMPDIMTYYIPNYFSFFEIGVMLAIEKVGMMLVNPLGSDDDDIELNSIIDYNIRTGLDIVDSAYGIPTATDDSNFMLSSEYTTTSAYLRDVHYRLIGSAVDDVTLTDLSATRPYEREKFSIRQVVAAGKRLSDACKL